jgi:hypothetical protein
MQSGKDGYGVGLSTASTLERMTLFTVPLLPPLTQAPLLLPFLDLSLSRLNHGQPGVQAHPAMVQGTAELHHESADARLPQADPIFEGVPKVLISC